MDEDKNDMLYWYPKIKKLNIPQPRTEIVRINMSEIWEIVDGNGWFSNWDEIQEVSKNFDYPLFLRGGHTSGKHAWKNSCFIKNEPDLKNHIYSMVESALNAGIAGVPLNCLAFRQYIPLESKFTAFRGEMPVAKERRYFIRDGKVQCHHPYWIPSAIRGASIDNWREELADLNFQSADEIKQLTEYAEIVGKSFDGYWSVDFAYGKDKVWYLIDMALGDVSFHWLDCKYCPEEMKEAYRPREEKGLFDEVLKDESTDNTMET